MNWDLFMTLILILTCMLTPLRLAFSENEEPIEWIVIYYSIDFLFLIDIIVIFNTAYYNEYLQIIDDRKKIAKQYISGWFTIDILAIVPFDLIMNATRTNQLVRFMRIGRLYKLVKLTRLLRVFKMIKNKSNVMKMFQDLLKVSIGFERLFFFFLMFIILVHIVTCLWIMLA